MDSFTDIIIIVRNQVDDYEQTVAALLAFGGIVTHKDGRARPDANFGFGRRMTTSENNRIRTSADVTPDLVVQQSESYGFVAEAKKSLNQERSYWGKHRDRLRKYDDKLTGWWTKDGTITQADTVMLIHQSRGRAFRQYLESEMSKDHSLVGPNTSIVEFNRADERAPYMFFRGEFGALRNPNLQQSLDEGVQVPLDDIQQSYPVVRYYDSKPPLELLLMHLWMDHFPSLLQEGEYDENLRATRIEISCSKITEEMQAAYGSGQLQKDDRSCEFPKKAWVREALSKLVGMKLASGPEVDKDTYKVYFRAFRNKEVLDKFIELTHPSEKQRRQDTETRQTNLFDLLAEEDGG